MRLLVGILYCGEKEFERCIDSIKNQSFQDFDYFVIENKPNKEAHDLLYQKFMEGASQYNYFLKIDADMVLTRNTFFEEVISEMEGDLSFDDLQIAVQDGFTDALIYGLHVYRNNVTWDISEGNSMIFVDRIEKIKRRKNDNSKLAPAAYHADDPHNFHAYHYGIHKAMKILQPGQRALDLHSSSFHYSNIIRTLNNYKMKQKETLLFALEGFNDVLELKMNPGNVDYNDQEVLALFNTKSLTEEAVIRKLNKNLKMKFPLALRYSLLMYCHSEHFSWIKLLKGGWNKQNKQAWKV